MAPGARAEQEPRVDTAKVTDRRPLRFETPQDVRAEVERIVAAERGGALRRSGNWTAGQALGHLATWINLGYEGLPAHVRPPWFIKLLLRFKKASYLRDGLPAGVRLPKVEGGTLGVEPLPLDEGRERLLAAWKRLEAAPPDRPNVVFGPLTHAEWIALNLRHAELHLGFLHPG